MDHPSARANDTHPSVEKSDGVESFIYDDAVVRKFLIAMIAWGIAAFALGLYVALELAFPELYFARSWLGFGRLRPLHTNTAVFAFAGNAIFAGVYYSTQRLCRARLWSDKLSWLHLWGWQLIILFAVITLPMGITQGRPLAEMQWPIALLFAVVWIGCFGVNFLMTLIHRRERYLYVSLWFYIATIIAVAILHLVNNLVLPTSLFQSDSIYAGAGDAVVQWWYRHNMTGFFLTMPFMGMMYYFVPKVSGQPLFSYRLSIVHFWSVLIFGILASANHLQYSPAPEWISTLGMLFGVMMLMPGLAGPLNGLLTLRGVEEKVVQDPALKFLAGAMIFGGITAVESSLLSTKTIAAFSGFTDWSIAHAHSAALGWNGLLVFGVMYYLLPRLFQTKLWSVPAAHLHFWMALCGLLLYVVPIYIAGGIQAILWRATNEQHQLSFPDFIEVTLRVFPMYLFRSLGGAIYLAGAIVGVVNVFKTWMMRPSKYHQPISTGWPLVKSLEPEPIQPSLTLDAMSNLGRALTVFSTLWWHRKWERSPVRFCVIIGAAVIVASALQIVPMDFIQSSAPAIASVKPYTPLELVGRDIYISEGCTNCHSQMIRPLVWETKRYGEYSKAGEYAFDRPTQWGSRRIGPDLAREGGKQSNMWHAVHLQNPKKMSPGSIMPPYAHLLREALDFKSISTRVNAMRRLGAGYTADDVINAETQARDQAAAVAKAVLDQNGPGGLADKKVVALIAYLQRLGTDLFKPVQPPRVLTPDQNEIGGRP